MFMQATIDNKEMTIREEVIRRFDDPDFMLSAIAKATRAAILEHKRIGNPIASWQDGKVVIIQPEDIVVPDEEGESAE